MPGSKTGLYSLLGLVTFSSWHLPLVSNSSSVDQDDNAYSADLLGGLKERLRVGSGLWRLLCYFFSTHIQAGAFRAHPAFCFFRTLCNSWFLIETSERSQSVTTHHKVLTCAALQHWGGRSVGEGLVPVECPEHM